MYSIDQINENIALLEEIETKEKINVSLDILPSNVEEGTIVKFENNKYIINNNEEKRRRYLFRKRLEKLKTNPKKDL